MKSHGKLLPAILLFCLAAAGHGEVFSLWPKTGKGTGAADAETALNPRTVWSEPVIINDVKLELRAGLIEMDMEEITALLVKLYPGAKFATRANSMLVIIKQPDGGEKRLLLVHFDGSPVIQFALTLPPKFPERFTWPDGLPRPGDSTPVKYMYFPKRNAYYGEFKTGLTPARGLEEIAGKISGDGWNSTVKRGGATSGNGGDIFLKTRPPAIMLVNFDQTGRGFIFTRPLARNK